MRTARKLPVGHLRTFEAVARKLGFGAAAQELHLTQPAVSRHIRGLEDDLGVALFRRGTRRVELTAAGETLLGAVAPMLDRLDATVRRLRAQDQRRGVAVTTFASMASMWLLPRLAGFQARHPDIDIRISATDALEPADAPELDLALRYCHPRDAPPGATALFDELLTPVASPALLARVPLRRPQDLAQHTLLEADDHRPSGAFLRWRRWLDERLPASFEPRGWLYLNYTHQQVQAALSGQGVALARWALAGELLERGELVEPFGRAGRVASPFGYWLVRFGRRAGQAERVAFEDWLLEQAEPTRKAIERAQDNALR